MKNLLILVSFLILSACSFKEDDSIENTAQIRQNEKVGNTYGDLVGKYSGTMTTAEGKETVDLIIRIVDVKIENPDGTPGIKKVPEAIFKRYSPIIANYYLSVNGYLKETGYFSLNSRTTAGPDDLSSIQAVISGTRITGTAITPAGTLGALDLQLKSKDVGAPNEDTSDEYRKRLIKQYKAIVGTYTGNIETVDAKKLPISIIITLLSEQGTPLLAGKYKRLDTPEGFLDLALKVTYRPDMVPPEISMNGNGGGAYIVTFDGTIQNGVLKATMNSVHQGFVGNVLVKKQY